VQRPVDARERARRADRELRRVLTDVEIEKQIAADKEAAAAVAAECAERWKDNLTFGWNIFGDGEPPAEAFEPDPKEPG